MLNFNVTYRIDIVCCSRTPSYIAPEILMEHGYEGRPGELLFDDSIRVRLLQLLVFSSNS